LGEAGVNEKQRLKQQREMHVLSFSRNRDHVVAMWHAIISLQVCMFAQASSNELQEVFVVGDIGKVQVLQLYDSFIILLFSMCAILNCNLLQT
jgi:predicted regulator of Ras-like GTPase activity (Roadblock/LC7/MglB family)